MNFFSFLLLSSQSLVWSTVAAPLLTGIDGAVSILRTEGKSQRKISVSKEMRLKSLDKVQTERDAHARVEFEGTQFELAPDTRIAIEQVYLSEKSNEKKTKKNKTKIKKWFFSLESGHLEFRLVKSSSGLDFKFGSVNVSSQSSENSNHAHGFITSKDLKHSQGFFQVACLEGVLTISPQDITLVPGEAAELTAKVSDYAPKPVGVGELKALRTQLGFKRELR